MKKQLLLLFILSSINISAMEIISSFPTFSSLSSYLPAWPSISQVPNESALVLNLQKNMDELENQLKLDKRTMFKKTYILPVTLQLFSTNEIHKNPDEFLQYCYYQKFHEDEMLMSLEQLKDLTLLNKCQNARIKGHSALSATMLAPDVSLSQKRDFNQQLINLDFKTTLEDIKFAEFFLYKSIKQTPQLKMALIHLLHPESSASWHYLPHDVKKLIAYNLVNKVKKDVWLLPDKQNSNCS